MKISQKHIDNMPPKWCELMERHPVMFEYLWRLPECDEGWFDLLDQLMTDIETEMSRLNEANVNESETNDNSPPKNVNIKILQIKEKFGGLRFYADINASFAKRASLYDLIIQAEDKSWKVCEKCGAKGKLRKKNSWMRTLCDDHDKEWLDADQ